MGNCLKRGVWTVFKLIGVGGGSGWGSLHQKEEVLFLKRGSKVDTQMSTI